ncbi:MAG: hypothetical protein NT138_10270 [Planctomycetales bacterium]|nr:hypothetical protein [Planctomycetales bacterium]
MTPRTYRWITYGGFKEVGPFSPQTGHREVLIDTGLYWSGTGTIVVVP